MCRYAPIQGTSRAVPPAVLDTVGKRRGLRNSLPSRPTFCLPPSLSACSPQARSVPQIQARQGGENRALAHAALAVCQCSLSTLGSSSSDSSNESVLVRAPASRAAFAQLIQRRLESCR